MRPGSGTREGSPQKLGEETKRGGENQSRTDAKTQGQRPAGERRGNVPAPWRPFAGGGWGLQGAQEAHASHWLLP